MQEVDVVCVSCVKEMELPADYVWEHDGIVYCAQCRALYGYIDGSSETPDPEKNNLKLG